MFEDIALVWLIVLTAGLLWAILKIIIMQIDIKFLDKKAQSTDENIASLLKMIDLLTEDVRVVVKFTHTHEDKPSYTFDVKDLN